MASNFKRSYDDFEPFCQWQRGQERDILEVHLQGFKKEQLKVQINNYGALTITGEKPINDDNSKISRFRKEIKVSKDLNADRIRAKYVNGVLYITLRHEIKPQVNKEDGQNNTNVIDSDKIGGCVGNSSCVRDGVLRIELSKKMAMSIGVAVALSIVVGGFLIAWKCSKVQDPLMY